jgi:hypothetical protein
MVNKDFILSKIKELEGLPKGDLVFKNNNIYLDHLNLSWLGNDLLRGYGVTFSLANKFNRFYGLIGDEAKTAIKKPFVLTSNDIEVLFKVSVRISIQDVSKHIGIDTFMNLPDPVQIILVSFFRQFERLTRPELPALAMTSKMLIRRHIKLAIRYLRDDKGWSAESKEFRFQRLKEIEMLDVFLKKGK